MKIQNFSFTKMHLKISSAKWRAFCEGGDALTLVVPKPEYSGILRSIAWSMKRLMPDHQHTWHSSWLWRVNDSLTRNYFIYLGHSRNEKWQKIPIYFIFPKIHPKWHGLTHSGPESGFLCDVSRLVCNDLYVIFWNITSSRLFSGWVVLVIPSRQQIGFL